MDDLRITIGTTALEARKRLRLTQEATAERIKVSSEYYARLERGHAFPSVPTLSVMMGVLGVSADDLLGLTVPELRPERPSGRTTHPAGDRAEVRRLIRRLRHASPATIRLIDLLVTELDLLLSDTASQAAQPRASAAPTPTVHPDQAPS